MSTYILNCVGFMMLFHTFNNDGQWTSKRNFLRLGTASILYGLALQTAHATTDLTQPPALPASIQAPTSASMDFEVKGKVKGFNYSASAKLNWQHNSNEYRAEQSIRVPLLGSRSQVSRGSITPQFLAPATFEDSQRPQRNLRFDASAHTMSIPATGLTQTTPSGVQDRLSVFFQLSAIVAADKAKREVGEKIAIWTAAHNKQEAWTFEVLDSTNIALPAGTMPAIKLQRVPRKQDDQVAQIWLSPQTGFLPVRIHMDDEGDSVDLQLLRYTPVHE